MPFAGWYKHRSGVPDWAGERVLYSKRVPGSTLRPIRGYLGNPTKNAWRIDHNAVWARTPATQCGSRRGVDRWFLPLLICTKIAE